MSINLDGFFKPKSIAIIGASKNPEKIGFVILNNLITLGYSGKIYPINPKYEEILELKCYKSVSEVGKIDLAIIVLPPNVVPNEMEQLGQKGTTNVIVVSGGFGEVNNEELKNKLIETCRKYKIKMIGPNCLGISYSKENLDTIFFPIHKLRRPGYGNVSLVTQSGGVGSSLLAIASSMGIGINKFISYGNNYILDESDFINYLADDKETKSIVVYIEGVSDGKKFLTALNNANKKKPIVILKAGKEGGTAQDAVKSHTGAMAGNYLAYKAVFKKAKVIEAQTMNELFDFIAVSNQSLPKGKRVGVISNGGGFGVMTADSVIKNGLVLPKISEKLAKDLSAILPNYATAGNPLDLVADADIERFSKSIDIFMKSDEFDMLVVSVLFQTPMINETLLGPLVKAGNDWRKPVVLVVPGGDEVDAFKKTTSMNGVPTFDIPERAVTALRRLYEYSKFRGNTK